MSPYMSVYVFLRASVFVISIASARALCVCVIVCVFVRIGPPRPLLRLAAGLVWLPEHIPAPAVTPLCDSKSRRGPTVSLRGK